MSKRKIIKIDEEKCNGCGLCIPNCPEGALQIIGGKARIVKDLFCDGLGACLGHCPQGALTIEVRDAEPFDEKKVKEHMANKNAPCACPGSKMMDFTDKRPRSSVPRASGAPSQLRQWPVQIMLVPPTAPYFKNADLLIAADCVPFAYADFHEELLKGNILLVGCPKLDDIEIYGEKIAEIVKSGGIKSITYARMEVPCCAGLVGIIKDAISASGRKIPFKEVVIGIKGDRLS